MSDVETAQWNSVIRRSGHDPLAFGFSDNGAPPGTKVLVPLGENALNLRCSLAGIHRYRGHIVEDHPFMLPTHDPRFLLPRRGEESSSRFTGVVIYDIRKAVKIATEGWQRLPTNYLIDPAPESAERWALDYNDGVGSGSAPYLSVDIETAWKAKKEDETEVETVDGAILRVGFAWKKGEALTVPWTAPYMEVIRYLLNHPAPITTWNGKLFDGPVIESNSEHLNGEHFDAMDFWHVLQPGLPRKLEFVSSFFADHLLPWKHTNKSDFARYNAMDADAGLCCMLGIEAALREITCPEYEAIAA